MVAFALGSAPEALSFVRDVVMSIVAVGAPGDALAWIAIVAAGIALQGVKPIVADGAGWARSLPVSGADRRRAMVIALLGVEVPLAAAWLICVIGEPLLYHAPLSPAKLAAFPLIVLGAAWLAVQAQRVSVKSAPGAARLPARTNGRLLWLRITYRAVGRRLLAPAPTAAIFLAACLFFRRNNELTGEESAFAARWGVLLALAVYVGLLANILGERRRPWPWARSLPRTSETRVLEDAAAIGLPAASCIVVIAIAGDWRAALLGTCALLLFAIIAAGAIRMAPGRITGAAGEVLVICVPLALALAWWPWLIISLIVLVPLAIIRAARRERSQRVSSWTELYHDAAGDTTSWRAR